MHACPWDVEVAKFSAAKTGPSVVAFWQWGWYFRHLTTDLVFPHPLNTHLVHSMSVEVERTRRHLPVALVPVAWPGGQWPGLGLVAWPGACDLAWGLWPGLGPVAWPGACGLASGLWHGMGPVAWPGACGLAWGLRVRDILPVHLFDARWHDGSVAYIAVLFLILLCFGE